MLIGDVSCCNLVLCGGGERKVFELMLTMSLWIEAISTVGKYLGYFNMSRCVVGVFKDCSAICNLPSGIYSTIVVQLHSNLSCLESG